MADACVNDPALEEEVLWLEEAEAAGIGRGELAFGLVDVPVAELAAMLGWDARSAKAWLREEVRDARRHGGASHWEDMLRGDVVPGKLPPVLAIRDEFPEIVDGRHRIAGHIAAKAGVVAMVVGVAQGFSLPAGWTRLEPPAGSEEASATPTP